MYVYLADVPKIKPVWWVLKKKQSMNNTGPNWEPWGNVFLFLLIIDTYFFFIELKMWASNSINKFIFIIIIELTARKKLAKGHEISRTFLINSNQNIFFFKN